MFWFLLEALWIVSNAQCPEGVLRTYVVAYHFKKWSTRHGYGAAIGHGQAAKKRGGIINASKRGSHLPLAGKRPVISGTGDLRLPSVEELE